jgi:hypothetical protein
MAASASREATLETHRVQGRADRGESSDRVWSKASSETERPDQPGQSLERLFCVRRLYN